MSIPMMNTYRTQPRGYIALVALLIIAAAGLTIGLAASFRGIDTLQGSLTISRGIEARAMANACVEEGLAQLRNAWTTTSAQLSFANGSCTMSVLINGSVATVSGIGTIDIFTQTIRVQVTPLLEVVSWEEE